MANPKISPQTLKGFRDFLPEQAIKRQYVIDKLRAVFEAYGFEPLETPALEYAQVLEGKYGNEGEKLIYKFKDRGGRAVALRYDLTVPLARVIAQYAHQLPLPFKRYQIQAVWRADKPQSGRFREFVQCDADIVGSDSITADLEVLSCVDACLKALDLKEFTILVNSRKIFDQLDVKPKIMNILDKEDKIGKSAMLKQLSEVIGSDKQAESFYLSLRNFKPEEIPPRLKQILDNREKYNLFFSPYKALVRGLDYYTDLIFEVRIPKYKGGSICGGGRYDNLIGIFSGQQIPAVGFSFGLDRVVEAMKELNLFPDKKSPTQVLVTIFSPELLAESIKLAARLRQERINTDLYPDPEAKLDKQLKYADRKGIPFVIILGPEEVNKKQVTVKNMETGEQKTSTIEKLISYFKSKKRL